VVDVSVNRQEKVAARSLRVLCAITAMGCGGAERNLAWLANRLSDKGHSVALRVLHGRDGFFDLDPAVGVRYLAEDQPRSTPALKRFFERPRWLRREIEAERPDVIISFIDVANVVTLWAGLSVDCPIVVSERIHPPPHTIPLWYEILRRFLYPRASRVVVQTEETAKWARKWLDPNRVVTIPNPVVAPTRVDPHSPQCPLPRGKRWMVAVGRLSEQKSFDKLIDVFAKIAPNYSNWHLVILGEGPERASLENRVRQHGLEGRVEMPGVVRNPEDYLRASDIFVLTSRYEGFPNVLCEAMACGLPVVSFDCPVGPGEIIVDGEDGLLVPAGDISALAVALRRLIENPDESARMADRATRVVERFGEETVAARWEELLLSTAMDRDDPGGGKA